MAPHSSIRAWRIPWTEEPGGLQPIGSKRVGHDWSDLAPLEHTYHFQPRNGFKIRDTNHAQALLSMCSGKEFWPVSSMLRTMCWAQVGTVNKPCPCSLEASAELTQGPPQIPPTPGPGAMNYLLNPLQGANPTLPETSSSHISTKIPLGPFKDQICHLCQTCPGLWVCFTLPQRLTVFISPYLHVCTKCNLQDYVKFGFFMS